MLFYAVLNLVPLPTFGPCRSGSSICVLFSSSWHPAQQTIMRSRCGSCLLAYRPNLRLSVYMCTICRWAGLNAAGFWCQSCRPCGLCRHCAMRLSVSLVVSRTALGVSDWPCGVRVSHKKVQMSPLNAAPNSNDNSMLMTLTLCQSSSQSNSVTAHCHTTPHHTTTANGRWRRHRLLGLLGRSVTCLVVWVDWQFGVLLK